MKNLQILSVILIMLGVCYGCRSRKLSNLNRDLTISTGEMEMKSVNDGNEKYTRKTVAADSSIHTYKLTIFPIDTFQFSLEKGYKGKAMKLEITGNLEQIRRIKDSVTFDGAQREVLEQRLLARKVARQTSRTKSMERTWINWWLIGSLIAVVLAVTVGFHRFMKKFNIIFAALVIIFATACQKDDIAPSKPPLKEQVIDCKKCEGGWDLTDSVP